MADKQIQVRRGTATDWSSNNSTLAAGEIGYDTTNDLVKIGDGSTAWSSLNAVNSGTFVKAIDEVVVGSGGTQTIDFSSIPATYRALRLVLNGRSSEAATASVIEVQLNGDTGANYDWHRAGWGAATFDVNGEADTRMKIGAITAASVTAGLAGGGDLLFPDYAGTVFRKSVSSRFTYKNTSDGAGAPTSLIGSGVWRSTAAITRITLDLNSTNLFLEGTVATLYGLNPLV